MWHNKKYDLMFLLKNIFQFKFLQNLVSHLHWNLKEKSLVITFNHFYRVWCFGLGQLCLFSSHRILCLVEWAYVWPAFCHWFPFLMAPGESYSNILLFDLQHRTIFVWFANCHDQLTSLMEKNKKHLMIYWSKGF